jgi:hypothetical protein
LGSGWRLTLMKNCGNASNGKKQDAMSMRVRQLWAPVVSTLLISVAVQFVALRVPQLPPSVFFTRNGVSIVVALGALPWLGRKATMRARGAAGL